MSNDFQSLKNDYFNTFCCKYSTSTIKRLKPVFNNLESFMPKDIKFLNISHTILPASLPILHI